MVLVESGLNADQVSLMITICIENCISVLKEVDEIVITAELICITDL